MNAAMNERIMWPARVLAWFDQNASELLIGAGFAAALVAAMLILRIVGRGIIRGDPHCRTWRSVIGRVFAKTSILFMVFAALDIVANYTSPPPKIAHPLDIAFTIVAALTGNFPGLARADAEALMQKGHQVCPYSNLITKAHEVKLSVA